MNSTTKTTKETIELEIRTSLIESQIKIAQMNTQEITTIAFPNPEKITDEDIENILSNILDCTKPEVLTKQKFSTTGSCSVSLWTIKI